MEDKWKWKIKCRKRCIGRDFQQMKRHLSRIRHLLRNGILFFCKIVKIMKEKKENTQLSSITKILEHNRTHGIMGKVLSLLKRDH